jgi:hypothetical protein
MISAFRSDIFGDASLESNIPANRIKERYFLAAQRPFSGGISARNSQLYAMVRNLPLKT